jgi:putative ABC transport system substrate-binding protein
MNRRTAIALIGCGAIAGPIRAEGQPTGKTYRIGYLFLGALASDPQKPQPWPTLRVLGYVEGHNLTVERRCASGRRDRLPAFASELIAWKPDVILAQGGQAAQVASRTTRDIPTVIMGAGDPVGTGLVKSLARPGGNITGLSEISTELAPKRLELLKEAVPTASRVAVLWNAADPAMNLRYREIETAAKAMHIEVRPLGVREPEDFDEAFSAMLRDRPDAMVMITDALMGLNRKRVVEFAAQNRLPTIYEGRDPVDDGGMMSYGPNLPKFFAHSAYYIDEILKGAKPADLPMEQPTEIELVVNLRAAKDIGIMLPASIIARADDVIE